MMRRLVGAAALACVVACGHDSSTAPIPENVDGAYTLAMVNGGKVPYTLAADGAYHQDLTSGTLTLTTDSSYVSRWTTTDYITGITPQSYPDSSNGKWTRSGNTVTLINAFDQSILAATFTGTSLIVTQTLLGSSTTLVYAR